MFAVISPPFSSSRTVLRSTSFLLWRCRSRSSCRRSLRCSLTSSTQLLSSSELSSSELARPSGSSSSSSAWTEMLQNQSYWCDTLSGLNNSRKYITCQHWLRTRWTTETDDCVYYFDYRMLQAYVTLKYGNPLFSEASLFHFHSMPQKLVFLIAGDCQCL